MRRFSQRSALVTLSEINITPLLDLAFVLLIIFVITTPLLERSLQLHLPPGGGPNPRIEQKDVRTVEISPTGEYRLNSRPMSLAVLLHTLVNDFNANPNLAVVIRADRNGRYGDAFAVIDALRQAGINRFDLHGEPPKR